MARVVQVRHDYEYTVEHEVGFLIVYETVYGMEITWRLVDTTPGEVAYFRGLMDNE